jgi:hypothetical protein
MPQSTVTCAVCHLLRSRGSFIDDGDFFICAGCQADAEQLFEIQDRTYGESDESTGGTETLRISDPAICAPISAVRRSLIITTANDQKEHPQGNQAHGRRDGQCRNHLRRPRYPLAITTA